MKLTGIFAIGGYKVSIRYLPCVHKNWSRDQILETVKKRMLIPFKKTFQWLYVIAIPYWKAHIDLPLSERISVGRNSLHVFVRLYTWVYALWTPVCAHKCDGHIVLMLLTALATFAVSIMVGSSAVLRLLSLLAKAVFTQCIKCKTIIITKGCKERLHSTKGPSISSYPCQ